MTIIMFGFASGMYFYCVNENVSLVLSAATPCCVKRGELQYICKQNSKPCYHIFYVQQTQDFGASIRLCCRMISVHTKYNEIWRCLQPTATTMKQGRREGGAPRRSSPATTGAPSSTLTALNDCGSFFWRLSYFYFLYFNTIICTFGSLHFLKTPPSRHHKTDFHPTRRKRRKQTERGIEREEKLMWPNQLTQNVDIWCPGN